ncbi:CaaX farnesyltransferase alpha subunit [Verticillium dahliae VdLs.17]|uniref:Protein farnesyltransferase/geranylgeranyltransferase type-1 subunit alpha n=1 Tax=Verticillium dahliae (strain VdLs.17 / ATCC MYA-4575 / FGSC 10137) TaxID=498257 RepID=G2XIJ2_VERDV|nr:CaaX farnesyltransferase alpha subunit [Verticillium dahliae VdLs.17]EGY20345.1 CaaX farnesyltransferase alpha subunit [Verticillium dahliae VdLs.17]
MPPKAKVGSKPKEAETKSLSHIIPLTAKSFRFTIHRLFITVLPLLGSPDSFADSSPPPPPLGPAKTNHYPRPQKPTSRPGTGFTQPTPPRTGGRRSGSTPFRPPGAKPGATPPSSPASPRGRSTCRPRATAGFGKRAPANRCRRAASGPASRIKTHAWGPDRHGRDVGDLPLDQFAERTRKQASLAALEALHRRFRQRRELAESGLLGPDGRARAPMTRDEIDEERQRRRTMAELKEALYGEKMGPYATDPDWDDVVPVSSDEPEGSLAAIAYPEHYAEIISYLRAVMAAEEHSPRTLRLTEHVIAMNPAHYTVWLYRFRIIQALDLPLDDEFAWLNGVSLDHLKNYQIWHHRQLLLDHVHARIGSDATAVKKLAHDESHFLRLILAEDTKNYHVWSYRQYLVRRLGLWTSKRFGDADSHRGRRPHQLGLEPPLLRRLQRPRRLDARRPRHGARRRRARGHRRPRDRLRPRQDCPGAPEPGPLELPPRRARQGRPAARERREHGRRVRVARRRGGRRGCAEQPRARLSGRRARGEGRDGRGGHVSGPARGQVGSREGGVLAVSKGAARVVGAWV